MESVIPAINKYLSKIKWTVLHCRFLLLKRRRQDWEGYLEIVQTFSTNQFQHVCHGNGFCLLITYTKEIWPYTCGTHRISISPLTERFIALLFLPTSIFNTDQLKTKLRCALNKQECNIHVCNRGQNVIWFEFPCRRTSWKHRARLALF